jgi:prepilin-type processing-associated H-X9-DG protein
MPAVDTTPNRWKFWYKFNLRYTDNAAIYYCPEKKEVKLLKIYEKGIKDPLEPVTFSENAQSYGLNHFASKRIDKKNKNNYKGQKLNSLSNPDYMVLFGDSNMPYLRPTTACWLKDYAPRHEENSSNYIMVDGHIENHNKKSLGIYNKIDGWNLDVKRWTGKD